MAEKTLPSDTPTAAMSGIVTWWQWSTAGNRADCTSPRETAFLRGILWKSWLPVTVAAQGLENEDGESIETANHAMMQCSIACETAFPAGSVVRKPVE
jgi:hypothetical protein